MKYEIYAHDFQRSFETLPKFILFGRAIPPYDVHAFPKVATLPDTEPTACQAGDSKMHRRYLRGGGVWRVGGGLISLMYQRSTSDPLWAI